ncbi:transposase, session 2 [Pyrococcus yayanosii CH1]|uniref:Transposase, session 2 n=1 Tax=Pyrococcus yayanosii (strain CH1 / JCM 16557) TaxID=529709 RepID=F8AHF9_PYRYC|nr:transposase, session 2 [Pyrococcus yayanosii CH1]
MKFKCPTEGLVFNADLVGAFNILKKVVRTITPSPEGLKAFRVRGNGGKTAPEGFREPSKGFLMKTPQTSPPMARG